MTDKVHDPVTGTTTNRLTAQLTPVERGVLWELHHQPWLSMDELSTTMPHHHEAIVEAVTSLDFRELLHKQIQSDEEGTRVTYEVSNNDQADQLDWDYLEAKVQC